MLSQEDIAAMVRAALRHADMPQAPVNQAAQHRPAP